MRRKICQGKDDVPFRIVSPTRLMAETARTMGVKNAHGYLRVMGNSRPKGGMFPSQIDSEREVITSTGREVTRFKNSGVLTFLLKKRLAHGNDMTFSACDFIRLARELEYNLVTVVSAS